jgi:hypothetical protein
MTVDADFRALRAELNAIRQELRTLKQASLPSTGSKRVASSTGTRLFEITHPDTVSPYDNATANLGMDSEDPESQDYGQASFGWWGKSDTYNFFACWLNNAAFYTTSASGSRYVVEWNLEFVNYNVPIKVVRLTTTERNALTPATGMIIYNTTTGNFEGYKASSWETLG